MDLPPGVIKHGWQWKFPRTKCRCIAGKILELIVDFSITMFDCYEHHGTE